MPYIEPEARRELTPDAVPTTAGALNYMITRLCLRFLGRRRSYADYNEVVGVLESVKLEFYRRAMVPYEEYKISVNGDVY